MKIVRVVAAVIKSVNDNGEPIIFATKRGYGDFKGGWEFPGGKVEGSRALKGSVCSVGNAAKRRATRRWAV